MAQVSADALKEIQDLLRAGKVQEADDLAGQHIATASAADAQASGEPAAPPPPREPNAILADILDVISDALGARGEIESLIEEFKSVL